ncbi:MAG: hypothetical protein AAGC93_00015 [Cyanobacteria bacterium P01_F01_bin.53]
MINLLTLSNNLDDRAEERAVKPLPENPSERSLDTLDLLVPWDIPLECQLSEPVKQQIEESLRSLITALNNPDLVQARLQILQLINTLPTPNTHPAQVKSTKTALSNAAVEDYDTYFHITHIQAEGSDDIGLSLTQGILSNCYKFISLCCDSPDLEPKQVSQQKQGFISYITLLFRVFHINNLS